MTTHTTRPAFRTTCRGLTLTELLVAVAVLAVIIVTFSSILAQANRVVSTGQQTMRANAAAAALDQSIRKDFRRMTHNGFLRITGNPGNQRLYFATAGPARSVTGGPVGTASIIGYGICDNPNGGRILWRGEWILSREEGQSGNFSVSSYEDVLRGDLADIQRMTYGEIDSLVDDDIDGSLAPASLTVPPQHLHDIGDLWMVLREDVEELEISYATGERDGGDELIWETDSGLWTRHNLDEWPKAVRIRIRLAEELLPAGSAPMTYEFTLPVRRAGHGLEENDG